MSIYFRLKSCENCVNAIRYGDSDSGAIMWDFGPPPDKDEIECRKEIHRFINGQEIVEASPGSDRYAAMGRNCDSWENRGALLPKFNGEEPIISPAIQ